MAAVKGGGNQFYEHGEVTTLRHTDTGDLYLWAVNRNCKKPDRLVISAKGPAALGVRDVLTGETVASESIEDGVRWSCNLAPGEGKLFALER